ncbi:serine-type D-Ala-D-Ala carboxypeptidase [Vibrio sonorensis]|uniref:serine-type D-Ala-D-Ala carboxypeptidase n=1 Tax=Vibrio sonorensis TaxID=1004316 RepID=UPI0008DAD24C|nr:serine-type D-Ala-D-Ala carboxypeptidase [Vibrio sonorensis]
MNAALRTTLFFSSIFAAIIPVFSFAYTPTNHLPAGSRSALTIRALESGETLLNAGYSDQFFPPASTLKTVTALAAKLELGSQFKFSTRIETGSEGLVIRFSGDPTLKSDDITYLLKEAKKQIGNTIRGDIWLDNSAFSGYERAVGWPWDILGVCYSAPASAITLDENCVPASVSSEAGGKTRVYVPPQYPIYVSTQAQSVDKAYQKGTQCSLELIANSDNHYQLQGCMLERKKPLPLKFAVQNPSVYTSRVISTLINQLGFEFNGVIKVGSPTGSNYQTLATHYSPRLDALLEEMLKKSDNLIADNLTKALGAHFFVQPGSFGNGTEAIKQIIFAHTGIDISKAKLADGSGLSRNNRFTVDDMAAILRYIWDNEDQLQLMALLPISGKNGTLKYRRSMRKTPIKDHIKAKSGSLYGSYNMAGYGLDENGVPRSLFVQFVTDYHPEKRDDNKPVVAPIVQFEKLFYQDVVEFSQAIPRNEFTTVK